MARKLTQLLTFSAIFLGLSAFAVAEDTRTQPPIQIEQKIQQNIEVNNAAVEAAPMPESDSSMDDGGMKCSHGFGKCKKGMGKKCEFGNQGKCEKGFHKKWTKVSGFIDAQFRWAPPNNQDVVPSYQNSENKNTFLINSGAFKFSHRNHNTHMHIDIPFMGDTTTGSLASNSFDLAEDLAQAFITHYYHTGVWWTLGQFDTAFGFEGNDTDSLLFTRQGLLYNLIVPKTHTGLLVGYHHQDFTFNLIAGNSQQNGVNGAGDNTSGTTKDEKLEYGLKFKWDNNKFRFGLGGLINDADGEYDDSGTDRKFKPEILVDAGLGFTIERFDFDLAYNSLENENGIEKSSGQTIDPVQGFLAQLVFHICERSSTQLRYEQVVDNTSDETLEKIALGYSIMTSGTTTLKAQLNYNKVDDGSNDDDYFDGALAAVYSF